MQIHGPSHPLATRPPVPSGTARGAAAASTPGEAAAPASFADLLTPEERAFFEQQQSMGALTYGRGRTAPAPPPAPTGQRVDVRG